MFDRLLRVEALESYQASVKVEAEPEACSLGTPSRVVSLKPH